MTAEAKSFRFGCQLLNIHQRGVYPSSVLGNKILRYLEKRPAKIHQNIDLAKEVHAIVTTLQAHNFDWNDQYCSGGANNYFHTCLGSIILLVQRDETHPDVLRHLAKYVKSFNLELKTPCCRTQWKTYTYVEMIVRFWFPPSLYDILPTYLDTFFEPTHLEEMLFIIIEQVLMGHDYGTLGGIDKDFKSNLFHCLVRRATTDSFLNTVTPLS
jgi:hypothetical protein